MTNLFAEHKEIALTIHSDVVTANEWAVMRDQSTREAEAKRIEALRLNLEFQYHFLRRDAFAESGLKLIELKSEMIRKNILADKLTRGMLSQMELLAKQPKYDLLYAMGIVAQVKRPDAPLLFRMQVAARVWDCHIGGMSEEDAQGKVLEFYQHSGYAIQIGAIKKYYLEMRPILNAKGACPSLESLLKILGYRPSSQKKIKINNH